MKRTLDGIHEEENQLKLDMGKRDCLKWILIFSQVTQYTVKIV